MVKPVMYFFQQALHAGTTEPETRSSFTPQAEHPPPAPPCFTRIKVASAADLAAFGADASLAAAALAARPRFLADGLGIVRSWTQARQGGGGPRGPGYALM